MGQYRKPDDHYHYRLVYEQQYNSGGVNSDCSGAATIEPVEGC